MLLINLSQTNLPQKWSLLLENCDSSSFLQTRTSPISSSLPSLHPASRAHLIFDMTGSGVLFSADAVYFLANFGFFCKVSHFWRTFTGLNSVWWCAKIDKYQACYRVEKDPKIKSYVHDFYCCISAHKERRVLIFSKIFQKCFCLID